jgi:hypothetical protein
MTQPRASLFTLVLLTCTALSIARADDGLKTIDNPGGGQLVYGPVLNQTTPQGAMATVLHDVHTHFGDRPQVGKVFQSRDGSTFGAFFLLNPKTNGNKPMAGLVIISMARGARPAAAVLYDESSRFAHTEPQLMRKLAQAWQTASTQPASSSPTGPAPSAGVPQLTRTRFPDGSGSVNLPPGWRIPFSSHGAAKIVGPRGELVLLGNSAGPIYDPNNPQIQARMRYANPDSRPLLCPIADALHTYVCLAERNGSTVRIKTSRPIPTRGQESSAVLTDVDVDMHDGHGTLACELGIGVTAPAPMGGRTLHLNGTCAPAASAAAEQPTLKAIFDSYSLNNAVVSREFAGDEARSRAAGNAARIQANNAHAAEDAQAASFQAHMDNIDRMSRSFENYTLDQAELQDNNQATRGAVPNSLADALIKSDPNRFESVPTQNFLKGVDF